MPLWARIDCNLPRHPKLMALGDIAPLAGWLYLSAICYSMEYGSDGHITHFQLQRLFPYKHLGIETGGVPGMFSVGEDVNADWLVTCLVTAGLLEEMDGEAKIKGDTEYYIHDFLEHQTPAKDLKKQKKGNAVRQARWRERNASRNGISHASPSPSLSDSVVVATSDQSVVPSGSRNVVLLQGDVQKFWEAYPPRGRVRSSQKTVKAAWTDLRPTPELAAKILAGLEAAKKSRDWTKEAGQFVPAAHRWLKNHGWEGHEAPQGSRASTTDEYGVRTMLLR